MGIFDFLFGGADDSAQTAQIDSNAATTALIKSLADRARADVMGIFPQSQQAQELGTQRALDVFGQTIPEQLQQFQGGNVAAQNTQRAALPQIQNALMGNPVDFNSLQTYQPALNTELAQQSLPQFPDVQNAIDAISMAGAGAYGNPLTQGSSGNYMGGNYITNPRPAPPIGRNIQLNMTPEEQAAQVAEFLSTPPRRWEDFVNGNIFNRDSGLTGVLQYGGNIRGGAGDLGYVPPEISQIADWAGRQDWNNPANWPNSTPIGGAAPATAQKEPQMTGFFEAPQRFIKGGI
tara:strand:+ start:5380 stop:6252 length:873 start_codon:yes stop_codon:yes gene_type:complete